mgnify:CR=1 FL=1|tara:strand:+ start:1708 stop:2130 length:423 start_codon:yes stop_codon:yes gene_type:complete
MSLLTFGLLAASSLQINRIFPMEEVRHMIDARLPPAKTTIVAHGDLSGFVARIVPTNVQSRVVLSMRASRMHLFLHEDTRFRLCCWDGHVSYDDKKLIVRDMGIWLDETNQPEAHLKHMLCDDEDDSVFSEVVDDLAKPR